MGIGSPVPAFSLGWQRLSIKTIFVHATRGFIGAAVVFLIENISEKGGGGTGPDFAFRFIGDIALAAFIFLLDSSVGALRWVMVRWKITGGVLEYESGVISRQLVKIPLDRIQGVDVLQPVLARLFQLAEVRVISAGQGDQKAVLRYLSLADGLVVRSLLIEGSRQVAPLPAPVPDSRVPIPEGVISHSDSPTLPSVHSPVPMRLFTVRNWVMVASEGLRIAPQILGVVAVVLIIVLAHAYPAHYAAEGGSVTIVLVGFGMLRSFSQPFGSAWNFTLGTSPDGLHIDGGLLQVRHETIPIGRIQSLRIIEPLLWRPFGWYRLEVDIARQRVGGSDERESRRAGKHLAPVAHRDEIETILAAVFPGVHPFAEPEGSRPPTRSAWLAPFSYHFLSAWNDPDYLYAVTGVFERRTMIVPYVKIQSIRYRRSFVQHWFRVATLVADTAGERWEGRLKLRDDDEARINLFEFAMRAEHARNAGGG